MGTRIFFNPGITLESKPVSKARVMVDQQDLLIRLAGLRREWEIATSGEMSKVALDLDLLFDDIANLISQND